MKRLETILIFLLLCQNVIAGFSLTGGRTTIYGGGDTLHTPWTLIGDGTWTGNSTLDASDGDKEIIFNSSGGFSFTADDKAWLELIAVTNQIAFGNTTDNQDFNFLGSGTITTGGPLSIEGSGSLLFGDITNSTDTGVCSWQVKNDLGYRGSMGIAGSAHAGVVPNSFTIYQQGYADTSFINNGNVGFSWWTEVGDTHMVGAYSKKLELTAAGDLQISPGTVVFIDTVWDDLPPTPITAARLGSSAPTLATFVSDIQQYTFDATNDFVIGATEITHGWKEGTAIHGHIHWATNGLEATAKGVQWQLKYTIGDFNEAFSAQVTTVVDATIAGNTADRTHHITDFDTNIAGTDHEIGAYICWRLERIATAHGNGEPLADPFGLAVGFHVEMDTVGSRTETAK